MKKLDFSSDFLSVIRGLVGMLFQHYQTKQNALKSKNDKNFKKMTKKKTLLCYNDSNTFQISNECMKSLIFNSI
ncbi:hypothetical protein JP0122_08600 [Helicobacter pylori]|nr:hypothetical protein JP0122_08600 [Helicobacter pylori]